VALLHDIFLHPFKKAVFQPFLAFESLFSVVIVSLAPLAWPFLPSSREPRHGSFPIHRSASGYVFIRYRFFFLRGRSPGLASCFSPCLSARRSPLSCVLLHRDDLPVRRSPGSPSGLIRVRVIPRFAKNAFSRFSLILPRTPTGDKSCFF